MTPYNKHAKLVTILWFVAALLAFIAVSIRYLKDREVNGAVAAAGAFCLVMGFTSLARNRQAPPT